MAISLVGVVNAPGSGAAATSFTTNVPAGVANGDLLIWTLTGNTVSVPGAPSGWNAWQLNSTTAICQGNYYRIASSEPASYTYSGLTSNRWGGSMLALRGVDTTTPIDVAFPSRNAGTTTLTYPAITPATAGAWVLAIGSIVTAATGVTDITWTVGNLTAVDTDCGTDNSGTTNCFNSHGHFGWTSGAFTPTGPATTEAATRTIGASTAVRPSAVTTVAINRITTTGAGRSLTASPGGASVSVGRITTSATARSLSGTPGAVTRAVARLTVAGTPRQLVASAIGPSSAAITRLLASSALRLVTAVSPTATVPEPVGTWTETAPRSFEEPDPADWIEPPAAFWTEPDPA